MPSLYASAQLNDDEIGLNDSFESNGQFSSSFTEVQGKYDNPTIGFSITLPEGWEGFQTNFPPESVIIIPEGVNETNISEQGSGMSISALNKDTLVESINFTKSLNVNKSLLNTTENFDENIQCTDPTSNFVNINGVYAEQITQECKGGDIYAKVKNYFFVTKDDSLIDVRYIANSAENFDKNDPDFQKSVETMTISEPGDIRNSTLYQEFKQSLEQLSQDFLDKPDS